MYKPPSASELLIAEKVAAEEMIPSVQATINRKHSHRKVALESRSVGRSVLSSRRVDPFCRVRKSTILETM